MRAKRAGIIFLFSLLTLSACLPIRKTVPQRDKATSTVMLGNEHFLERFLDLVKGKRVALLTNSSGVTASLKSTADVLAAHPAINLVALFAPEHGIRGAVYAGEKVQNTRDNRTGLPVYSLYGKNRKPTKKMLDSLDVILVDIQDVGIRAYTYIYTMALVMEAAAQYHKTVIVLDRPNPLGGLQVEGNILEKRYASFVGLYPIPYRHGMTIGELALLFNQAFNIHCNLKVIPMRGWQRWMYWEDTGLFWVPTSPHVPGHETPLYLAVSGTLGELQTVSEGVGYTMPFQLIGAPWIEGYQLAEALNNLALSGVYFRPIFFRPYYARFKGQLCQGVQIHILNKQQFNAYTTGLHILQTLIKLYPEQNILTPDSPRISMFQKVLGCNWIIDDLLKGVPVQQIRQKWLPELATFKKLREQFLLY